jgi:hypothetical protein
MSSPLTPGGLAPAYPVVWDSRMSLYVADSSVDLSNLSVKLAMVLGRLASMHFLLFDQQLIVTHGKDGQHVVNSKHYVGKAVDVRVRDKDRAQQGVFLAVLGYFVPGYGLAVFDERARAGETHFHIEEAN